MQKFIVTLLLSNGKLEKHEVYSSSAIKVRAMVTAELNSAKDYTTKIVKIEKSS